MPPAALCIHLCIGMAYGFSVFWKPLQGALLGADGKAAARVLAGAVTFGEKSAGTLKALTATDCNWSQFDLGWMFTFFFVLLGVSAAIWGGWLERVGPRKAALVSALCWCGGLLIAALGVYVHQLWLMWLGAGVIGGIGLGPRLHLAGLDAHQMVPRPARHGDRHGHHGLRRRRHDRLAARHHPDERLQGGAYTFARALHGAQHTLAWTGFRTATDVGVWQTFVAMAAIYFVFMLIGAFGYRLPPAGWQPEGWTPPANGNRMITSNNVHLKDAHKTPQFWLLVAHPVHERVGRHRHHRRGLAHAAGDLRRRSSSAQSGARLPRPQEGRGAARGSGCRRRRRLRRPHLAVQHLRPHRLGVVLRPPRTQDRPTSSSSSSAPRSTCWPRSRPTGRSWRCSSAAFCVIASMYGGGFATIPAYLADMFGTQFVGAIHGRLLTAWSTAGIVGPVIVNYMHDTRQAAGIAPDQIYGPIFYTLAGLLVVGFVANLLVRPVNPKWHMSEADVAAEHAKHDSATRPRRRPARSASAWAASTSRPCCSGCSSASRSPGASGTRSRRRWCCSAKPDRRQESPPGRRRRGSRLQYVQRPMRPNRKLSA